MKLISISGTSSNVGKTAVGEFLLRFFPTRLPEGNLILPENLSALKITTRHKGRCFKGSCGVCDSIRYPYVIKTESDDIIAQEGKDTARLSYAGAKRVIWLLSYPEMLKEGVMAALSYFDDNDIIIVEGNSLLTVHKADIAILVTKPFHREIKRSALIIFDKIDIVLINKERGCSTIHIDNVKRWLKEMGCNAPAVEIDPYSSDTSLFYHPAICKIFG